MQKSVCIWNSKKIFILLNFFLTVLKESKIEASSFASFIFRAAKLGRLIYRVGFLKPDSRGFFLVHRGISLNYF
jgi:hypothetical protein